MTPFLSSCPSQAFSVTPSDTADIKDDAANPGDYSFCVLHNPGASDVSVRVLPAAAKLFGAITDMDDLAVTISVPAGGVNMLAVRRVYATDPVVAAGALIAYVGLQR